ncbi:MAG: ATP-dependent helicase HrpB [Rhizobiaceae bacterium]
MKDRIGQHLPVEECLPELCKALASANRAILGAPPGAGKTTRVPLALLDQQWCSGKVLVLEPRRIAARSAASFVSRELGETPGATVGYRVRMESRTSRQTRVEYVTEGIFTRQILADPELSGVSAVIFDEFHERSLDADLGLALALDVQSALRPDLRILVMSATLDLARLSAFMENAPVIESEGRPYPVEIRYQEPSPGEAMENAMARVILSELGAGKGSVLAFLPGLAAISRVASLLDHRTAANISVHLLHGSMPPEEQDRAIRPAAGDLHKVVLASPVAETSITIDGVNTVIDSGLARVPRYEPRTGLTRLETVRAPVFSINQRAGRAGRTGPGKAIRLWSEPRTASLPLSHRPEILEADLSGLVIALAQWGVHDPGKLRFLDAPHKAAWKEAVGLLQSIGALDTSLALTPTGRNMSDIALPPRYAAMVVRAASFDQTLEAAELALLVSERNVGGRSPDLSHRMDQLHADRGKQAKALRSLAQSIASTAKGNKPAETVRRLSHGALLSLAWPQRIARNRSQAGQFLLANGRGAVLDETQSLAREKWLAVAELQGSAQAARIISAAPISEDEIRLLHEDGITAISEVFFDTQRKSARLREASRLGAIALNETISQPSRDDVIACLSAVLAREGIASLTWSGEAERLRHRLAFLSRRLPQLWPDVSEERLSRTVEEWLFPFVPDPGSLTQIPSSALVQGLRYLVIANGLPEGEIERQAPGHFTTPAGSRIALRYEEEQVVLPVKVQELYGLTAHPSIAAGKVPLTLELLSPAMRPIQVTRDLPGFWKGSWASVRTEMRGRYPKHVWPEDPANASPTTRARPRSH